MVETPLFRTAVGGFHKSDVTAYIAKTAKDHQAQLQEKDKEITQLQQQLEQALSQLTQQDVAPDPVPEPAPVAAEPSEDSLDRLELEAYRRAEAAERIAFQRAKKLYEALGNICTEARTQLESADSAARNSITAMELQLQTLKDSCDALTAALSGARQQLLDMDVMIPDPAEGLEEV